MHGKNDQPLHVIRKETLDPEKIKISPKILKIENENYVLVVLSKQR